MSTLHPVPRYPFGEYAYQALWWAAVVLPVFVAVLRALTTRPALTFFLFAVIAIPAMIGGQLIAGLLARVYRRRQWRHWLGPAGATLSLLYYGAWVLFALSIPDASPEGVHPSPVMRLFGEGFANGISGVLVWTIALLYVALLASIVIEGQQAVKRWS